MMNRILIVVLTAFCASGASAGPNCRYPTGHSGADAKQRAAHQRQLIENAPDSLKQYCAKAAEATGGSVEACLVVRGYLRELCGGADNGFPVTVDARFLAPGEDAVLTKVMPPVNAQKEE